MSEPPAQLGLAALHRMSPAQIDTALRAGRLDELLAGRDPGDDAIDPETEQVTDADLAKMTPQEVAQAEREGRLVRLLGGKP